VDIDCPVAHVDGTKHVAAVVTKAGHEVEDVLTAGTDIKRCGGDAFDGVDVHAVDDVAHQFAAVANLARAGFGVELDELGDGDFRIFAGTGEGGEVDGPGVACIGVGGRRLDIEVIRRALELACGAVGAAREVEQGAKLHAV